MHLLAWVLAPLACAMSIDTWLTYKSSVETATVVQDRLLMGSARMIAEQISYEDGSFQHQIPPAALELFQSVDVDRVFYRVTTGSGQLLSGYRDFPLLPGDFSKTSPQFFNATMRGEAVRVVAFFQPVIGNPSALPVTVEVAQTTRGHEQLAVKLWMHVVVQQLLILALATVFILFGLHRGLQPLIRLRDDVRSRKEGSLQMLQTQRIPSELTPLVQTFNDYIQRLETYTISRSTFIQNAAHQLRTPLAILTTQISDALLADSKAGRGKPLLAARKTLQQTIRLVNQFLMLSSAEDYVANKTKISTQECCNIVQTVLEELASQAHAKSIDLGFERSGKDLVITSDLIAFREIAQNLIENAIRYTQNSGTVTARIESGAGQIILTVQDDGPGIPLDSHDKVFQRFFRVPGTDSLGSGLGLAIVKEFAVQCGASVTLSLPPGGDRGLCATVYFVDAMTIPKNG